MKRIAALLLSTVFFAGYSVPANGRISYRDPVSYIGADGNLYITGADQTRSTLLLYHGASTLSGVQWSRDESRFVVAATGKNSTELYFFESGKAPDIRPVNDIGFPAHIAWSPDNTQLAYINRGDPETKVVVISLANGGETTFGSINLCIGEAPFLPPESYLLAHERGSDPFRGTPYLSWTDDGILFGADCATGPAVYSSDGKLRWQSDPNANLTDMVVVSRDGKEALVTDNAQIPSVSSLDLATGNRVPIDKLNGDTPLGWTSDKRGVFYSTSSDAVDVEGDEAKAAIGNALFGYWPLSVSRKITTIWQSTLDGNGKPRQLFEAEGFELGGLAVAPDDSAIVFSFITSSAGRIEAINAGATLAQAQAVLPAAIELVVVPLKDGLARQFAPDGAGQPATGSGAFEIAGIYAVK